MQYVFLWASGAPNSRAAPGSPHSSYDTVPNQPENALLFFYPLSIEAEKRVLLLGSYFGDHVRFQDSFAKSPERSVWYVKLDPKFILTKKSW